MYRVTKSGGVVATTMWDGSRANELQHCLWEAALAVDLTVKPFRRKARLVWFCRSAYPHCGMARV